MMLGKRNAPHIGRLLVDLEAVGLGELEEVVRDGQALLRRVRLERSLLLLGVLELERLLRAGTFLSRGSRDRRRSQHDPVGGRDHAALLRASAAAFWTASKSRVISAPEAPGSSRVSTL